MQSEPSRVSEPVSLNTAGSQGGSSHGAGSANEEEDSPGGSDKNGSGTEGEGTEETGESEEDLDLDPTFVAPFKHRNVLMDEGAIFKQKYERAAKELDYTKKRLQQQHEDDLEQLMALKKQLEKKVFISIKCTTLIIY